LTTIATDGVTIACDGLAASTIVSNTSRKKVFMHDGEYYGIAGAADFISAFLHYLKGDLQDITFPEGEFQILILNKKGKAFLIDGKNGLRYTVKTPFAIGSGAELALGAMAAGASPEKAVRIAKKYNLGTGGVVRSYHRNAL